MKSGVTRLKVHVVSNAFPLLQKGLLVPVREIGGSEWICEVHPAIRSRRSELLARIERHFGGPPPQYVLT
jgi:hypothetical protein